MIKLTFAVGKVIRNIIIDNRRIQFISPEFGSHPIELNLNDVGGAEVQGKMIRMKLSLEDQQTIRELSLLRSEEDIAKDILHDFGMTGWNLVKRERI